MPAPHGAGVCLFHVVWLGLHPLGSRGFAQHPVGADAYIGPAECTNFTGISGEFAVAQRVDVGIDPYNRMRGNLRIRRQSTAFRRVQAKSVLKKI